MNWKLFKLPSKAPKGDSLSKPASPKLKFPPMENLLKKLPLSKIPGLSALNIPMGPKEVLVFEVGDSWLKLAAVREGKLVAIDAGMIEGASDLDISQQIMSFVRKQGLKPMDVILSHPSHNLTTRVLSLPSVDPKEIKDIVELQAVKQTPYSREEITSGFQIVDTEASGYSRVLVAISHRETAARYFKISETAGFFQSRMTASLEGTRAWFKSLMNKGKIAKGESVLLLDVDWLTTDLHLFNGEQIVFSRSLGLGAKNLMEQGTVAEGEFVREIQRSMESGAAEMKDHTLARVVLSGVQKPLKDFSAALVRELNLPCEVMSVLEGLSSEVTLPLEEYSVSFVATLGLAFHPETITIDLTPPEIQIRKNLESRGKDLMFSGTLLVALISILSIVSVEKIYKRSSYLGELKKQYRSVQPEAESVERLVAKMKLAEIQGSDENGVLDVLRDINEVIPPNITLSAFSYDSHEKTVTIRGVSSEMSGVFQFLSTLEGTPALEQVKTRNVSKRKVDDKELAEFEIAANVRTASSPAESGTAAKQAVADPLGPGKLPIAGGPEIRGAK